MQRAPNQRAKLSLKFDASLFSTIVMHTQKNRIKFALPANHPVFLFEA